MTAEGKRPSSWFQLILLLISIFLGIEVVVLMIQNRTLKENMRGMSEPLLMPLKQGDLVTPVNFKKMDGSSIELKYSAGSRDYLLFVFSTTCPYCEKNLPTWRDLAQSDLSNRLEIMGVSIRGLEETRSFAERLKTNFFTVSAEEDTSFRRKYGIVGVPTTMLIGGTGVVKNVWMGVLDEKQRNEIKEMLAAEPALAN